MSAFPWQYARTRRFTLGQPRSFTVAPEDVKIIQSDTKLVARGMGTMGSR